MAAAPTPATFTAALRTLDAARAELDAALARLALVDCLAFAQLGPHVRDVRHGRVGMQPDGTGLLAAAARMRELAATVRTMTKESK